MSLRPAWSVQPGLYRDTLSQKKKKQILLLKIIFGATLGWFIIYLLRDKPPDKSRKGNGGFVFLTVRIQPIVVGNIQQQSPSRLGGSQEAEGKAGVLLCFLFI